MYKGREGERDGEVIAGRQGRERAGACMHAEGIIAAAARHLRFIRDDLKEVRL